jgi:hypothetical protein
MRSIFTIPMIVALVLVAATTVLEGVFTERWSPRGDPAELAAMAERMTQIPLAIGDDWEGEDIPPSKDLLAQYKEAGVIGHLDRQYRHRRKGSVVRVSLMCGHARHLSIHTPDQCYIGAGFEMLEPEPVERSVLTSLSSEPVLFHTAQFVKKKSQPPQNQRIMWSWCDEQKWYSPGRADVARFHFALSGNLYKLYVTTVPRPGQSQPDDEAGREFLRDFLPAIQPILYPQAASQQPAPDADAADTE